MMFHSASFPFFSMESPVTTAYVSTSPESKFRMVQDDDFLLQAHLPWIWNHYKPQIDQPQVSKKKCHFNRMEFTILFLRLPQNVSILYKQKTHLTNIHLLSPSTKDSNNGINLPSNKKFPSTLPAGGD